MRGQKWIPDTLELAASSRRAGSERLSRTRSSQRFFRRRQSVLFETLSRRFAFIQQPNENVIFGNSWMRAGLR
jgi:hypothetical protein